MMQLTFMATSHLGKDQGSKLDWWLGWWVFLALLVHLQTYKQYCMTKGLKKMLLVTISHRYLQKVETVAFQILKKGKWFLGNPLCHGCLCVLHGLYHHHSLCIEHYYLLYISIYLLQSKCNQEPYHKPPKNAECKQAYLKQRNVGEF